MSKYEYYDGVNVKNFTHIIVPSTYNNNYYEGIGNDLLFAKSNDDNKTEWFVIDESVPKLIYIGVSYIRNNTPQERIEYGTEREY